MSNLHKQSPYKVTKMESNHISALLKPHIQEMQRYLTTWMVRRPGLTLTFVILLSVIVLPLITSAALTPFILLLDFCNFLNTKGTIAFFGTVYVIYAVLFEGLALAILLVILFFFAFTFATIVSLLHSYSFFYK